MISKIFQEILSRNLITYLVRWWQHGDQFHHICFHHITEWLALFTYQQILEI